MVWGEPEGVGCLGGWREQRKAEVKGIVGEWNIYPKLRNRGEKEFGKGYKVLEEQEALAEKQV